MRPRLFHRRGACSPALPSSQRPANTEGSLELPDEPAWIAGPCQCRRRLGHGACEAQQCLAALGWTLRTDTAPELRAWQVSGAGCAWWGLSRSCQQAGPELLAAALDASASAAGAAIRCLAASEGCPQALGHHPAPTGALPIFLASVLSDL